MHMHYGVEEMFFVLSGTLTVRTPEGVEELSPGDVVYFPEGRDGLHDFSNPTDEPVEDARHLDEAVPGCRRLPGAGHCLGGYTASRTRGTRWRRRRNHRSLRTPCGRLMKRAYEAAAAVSASSASVSARAACSPSS